MKLVISVAESAWRGTIYPTQSNRGARQTFASPDELLRAVAFLTGWQSSYATDRSVGREEASD